MSYFISVSDTVRDHFIGETGLRYLRVVIDPDGTPVTYVPMKVQCNAEADYQRWNFSVKNKAGLSVGLHANLACTVDFSHDGSTWITCFTGFVSDDGLRRTRGSITDDEISLDLVDATKRKGTKRKPDATLLAGFDISDTASESTSILHYLASLMGATVEATDIEYTKTLAEIGKDTVWTELQKLRDAFHADMYFRYDGKLLFHSPFDTGYSAPSSEWTFQGDPANTVSGASCWIKGKVEEVFLPVRCNYGSTRFDEHEALTTRVIYKNTENYNSASDAISIVLAAGAYWPGPGATDVAKLMFSDPDSGESYPFAIDVTTPTLGAYQSGEDIESTGGTLAIISFNGSTSATTQGADHAQIILRNSHVSESCTIRKLTISGDPYRLKDDTVVEHVDAAVTDAIDYVQQEVDGKYMTSASQAFDSLYHIVEEGKGRPRQFRFGAPFMPWIQRNAIVSVQLPDESAVRCRIDTYTHSNRGRTLQGMWTSIVCTQLGTHTPTGSGSQVVTPSQPAWQAKLVSIAPNAGATYRSASAEEPVTPFLGDLWYQTDTQLMKRYDGDDWQNTGASPLEASTEVGVSFSNASGNVKIYEDGTLEAINGKFTGTLRTGTNAPADARVGIRDESGIVEFSDADVTGLNDLSIVSAGAVAVTARVKMETIAPTYAVGSTGPAGGIIFYIKDGVAYECAPVSTEWSGKVWGGHGTLVGGTSAAIGTGAANTEAIVAKFGATEPYQGKSDYAAKICNDLSEGGYSDWYLPSKNELSLMYQVLCLNNLGGFSGTVYWSSSEYYEHNAWIQNFNNGLQVYDYKRREYKVRAIRSFTLAIDTFKVSTDDGISYGSEITIPANRQYDIPDKEITIGFGAHTGHTVGDYWRFVQGAMKGLSILDSAGSEYLSASGGEVGIKKLLAKTATVDLGTSDDPLRDAWFSGAVNIGTAVKAQYAGSSLLPNGMIVKWGRTSLPSSAPCEIEFPVQFPNYCVFAVGTTIRDEYTLSGYDYVDTYDQYGIDFISSTAVGTYILWMALGY
jgi:hypothetical protein